MPVKRLYPFILLILFEIACTMSVGCSTNYKYIEFDKKSIYIRQGCSTELHVLADDTKSEISSNIEWTLDGNKLVDIKESTKGKNIIEITAKELGTVTLNAKLKSQDLSTKCRIIVIENTKLSVDLSDESIFAFNDSLGVITKNNELRVIDFVDTVGAENIPNVSKGVVGFAMSNDYATLLLDDGSVIRWKEDREVNVSQHGKELGLDVTDRPIKIEEPKQNSKIVKVANRYVIDENGKVYYLLANQLDEGEFKEINASAVIVDIASYDSHWVLLSSDGRVFDNDVHMLPEEFANTKFVSIAAAPDYAAGVGEDGYVYYWSKVKDFTKRFPVNRFNNIKKVSVSNTHCIALSADGKVFATGDNNKNQCAVPSDIQGKTIDISAGQGYSVALTSDGQIHLWGEAGVGLGKIGSWLLNKDSKKPFNIKAKKFLSDVQGKVKVVNKTLDNKDTVSSNTENLPREDNMVIKTNNNKADVKSTSGSSDAQNIISEKKNDTKDPYKKPFDVDTIISNVRKYGESRGFKWDTSLKYESNGFTVETDMFSTFISNNDAATIRLLQDNYDIKPCFNDIIDGLYSQCATGRNMKNLSFYAYALPSEVDDYDFYFIMTELPEVHAEN